MNTTPKDLRELVLLAMDRRGLSGRQLAFKAQDQGFPLTSTTVNHIKAGTYKSVPSDETVRALAWLAEVPEDVAFKAAGKPLPGPPMSEELPPGSDLLSPKSRKAVLDIMRVLIDLEQAPAHADTTTSTTAPTEQPASAEVAPRVNEADEAELARREAVRAAILADDDRDEVAERRRARTEQKSEPEEPKPELDENGLPVDPKEREAFFLSLAANRGPKLKDDIDAFFDRLGEDSQDGSNP